MANDIVLEPDFHMPPGVENLRYKDVEEYDDIIDYDSEVVDDDLEFSGSDVEFEDYELDEDPGDVLPPDYMTIVSQTVRTLPGGGQVVDVTIELPDLEEGDKYEVKLSK